MNIEKIKELIDVANEVRNEGVYGFNLDRFECRFQVDSEEIKNNPNLEIEDRGGSDYPYEIFVQYDGFKIFALITNEQIKEFPQFKEQAKSVLLKQLAELEGGAADEQSTNAV